MKRLQFFGYWNFSDKKLKKKTLIRSDTGNAQHYFLFWKLLFTIVFSDFEIIFMCTHVKTTTTKIAQLKGEKMRYTKFAFFNYSLIFICEV